MDVIGVDLGGTKIAGGIISEAGKIIKKETIDIKKMKGAEVSKSIGQLISSLLEYGNRNSLKIMSAGVSVPGIYYSESGKVWAPNIKNWEKYPLLEDLEKKFENLAIKIDNDRACYILGETWQGIAKDCKNAIFIAVGTGIGAGIMVDGNIIRGSHDIAGATGWMALGRPFKKGYKKFGCFEYHSSGDGLARSALDFMQEAKNYNGALRKISPDKLTSYDIFREYEIGDIIARMVINQAVQLWGMAAANFISLFNPEMIIFGGGVFGPAAKLINEIKKEVGKWAQPIAFEQVSIATTNLGSNAGLIGAGKLAFNAIADK